jgi:carnitine-CoA ligase
MSAMRFLDYLTRNVQTRGDHVFAIHEGRRVTYRDFDALVNQCAHALRSLGLVKGDRVTIAMSNGIEYLVAAFGTQKAGGVLNPVNPMLGAGELAYILEHAVPRIVITTPDAAGTLTGGKLTLPAGTTLAAFGPVPGAVRLDELGPQQPTTAPDVVLNPDDFASLMYTSGTTGAPKGVLFAHGRSGTTGQVFCQGLGIGPDDVVLAVTPLFHGNAWGAVQVAIAAGGTVVFPKAFKGSEFWPLVHEHGVTFVFTLGTVLAMLLARDPSPLERNHKLRVILGLGSASVRDRVIERFGVTDVAECFGSSDAGVVTLTPLGVPPRPGSCGAPVPGVRLEIRDDDGHALPPRQIGEIAVHSPASMSAYFKMPDETAQALRDGWFFSGDLGFLDEDGWLYFVDRKRDVIRRGGENVSSVLVEKIIREHPAVAEVAVIGVPEPVLGQEIKAYVVAQAPVTADELRAFAAERLAKFQVPRLWEFREALPKTATQRVEKYKLRQEHDGGRPLLG